MNKLAEEYKKEEIEQKIADIKWALGKTTSPFEKRILNDVLAIWGNALSDLEGGAVNE